MQPAERLPCRLVVALESHIRGDFVTDFAEADFCAEYRVIHPQTSFIHARRPRLRPQIGQAGKSAKGPSTAGALDSPTNFSIIARIVSLAKTLRRSMPSDFANSTALR